MTITRILPGLVLVVVTTAGPAAGQYGMSPYTPPGRAGALIPSVLPAGAADTFSSPVRTAGGWTDPQASGGTAAPVTGPDRLAATVTPGTGANPDPVGTLTAPPGPGGLPVGSYGGPWFSDGPGCCGPLGRNGQIAYELYGEAGPAFLIGGGQFLTRLQPGIDLEIGGRSLFFNPAGDAAWVVDLGLSYTYNRGSSDHLLDLFIRQPQTTTTTASNATVLSNSPDILETSRIRALTRTSFNYALGRDWFIWGPGNPGRESGWNVRAGVDLGGQWGSAHVDVVPNDTADSYARRQNVYQGIFMGAHVNAEVPLGGWIWFGGLRLSTGYQWMNIVPPVNGDVSYINLLASTGFRF